MYAQLRQSNSNYKPGRDCAKMKIKQNGTDRLWVMRKGHLRRKNKGPEGASLGKIWRKRALKERG